MAVPTIQRPLKQGNARSYVEAVDAAAPVDVPIVATEVDADLDTVYAGHNALVGAVNALPAGTGTPTQLALWDGAALLAGKTNLIWEDTTGRLTLPLRSGANGAKGLRLTDGANAAVLGLLSGPSLYVTNEAGVPANLTVAQLRSASGAALISMSGSAVSIASGPLIVGSGNTVQVARDPTAALEVATKQYVDGKTHSLTAGGDLTGSYPDPTINALAVTDAKIADVAATKLTGTIAQARLPVAPAGLLTANINDAQITDAKIAGLAYSKLTGAPTALPPNGAATGSLAGSYPAPTLAAQVVRGTPSSGGTAREILKASIWAGDDLIDLSIPTTKLAASAVTDAKIADVAATKLTGTIAQARLPVAPSGLLTANINDAQITDAKIAGLAYGKLTGAPTTLPPSGPAGGDLGGSFPTPVVDALNGAPLGVTTPLARGDLLVADATPAIKRLALGANQYVLQSNGTDVLWGPSLGGPPTGAAGGSFLTGTYPNPGFAPTALIASTAAGDALRWGERTAKGHLGAAMTADAKHAAVLSLNTAWPFSTTDDPAATSVLVRVQNDNADVFGVLRANAVGGAGAPVLAQLMKLDSIGTVTLTNPSQAIQTTIHAHGVGAAQFMTNNYAAPQVATKASWALSFDTSADQWLVGRRAANAAAGAIVWSFVQDSAGSITISGPVATKSTGTTWANPSDPRLKTDVGLYTHGLAELCQLEPITYRYTGEAGTLPDVLCYGLDAAAVQPIMPECVGTMQGKLTDDATESTELLTLDISPMIFAMVNAVKELAARVAALEAPA